jgi:high-affinity Fe2+/Pb2+ permease
MQTKVYLVITGVLFGLITILQATRLINRWPAVIGTWNVPLWISGIAVIVAAGLCIWAFCLFIKAGRQE